jgi:hypothetical protein
MERRHEEALLARLEAAFLDGYSFISWNELYSWYDVLKIAAGTWRDLQERWQEVCDDDKNELNYLNRGDGIHIFPSVTYSEKKITKLSVVAE